MRDMLPRLARWTRGRLTSMLETTGAGERAPGVVPEGYEELVEGSARAIYRKGAVFYNPVQVVNRDLSVQVLRWLVRERGADAAPLRVLEALSATGLRSIRYFQEVPGVGTVTANDVDPAAVATIRANVQHNGLDPACAVIPQCGDAREVLALAGARGRQFDVVDLDPYGSAAGLLDGAVRAVADGGVLAVTCTDLPVLCGNAPEICFARYAGTPLKGPPAHEMAVRLVLAAVNAAANRHARAVEPLVCAKIDFYVRVFVRVRDSRRLAQQTPARSAIVLQCAQCATQRFQALGRVRSAPVSNTSRKKRRAAKHAAAAAAAAAAGATAGAAAAAAAAAAPAPPPPPAPAMTTKYSPALVQAGVASECAVCRGAMTVGGPMWAGPLVDPAVADSIIDSFEREPGPFKARARVEALLRVLREEVADAPLFMHLPSMCRVLRVSSPPAAAIRAVLVSRGYRVSQSHTDPMAIKTDAPPELLWDILRLWVGKVGNPFRAGKHAVAEGTPWEKLPPGARIMSVQPTLVTAADVDFTVKKDRFVRKNSVVPAAPRFLPNPEPNWGPKARAGKRKREPENGALNG